MIGVGKKLFGGVGAYPVQPAVLAVAMLQLSWPQRMDYTAAMKDLDWSGGNDRAVTAGPNNGSRRRRILPILRPSGRLSGGRDRQRHGLVAVHRRSVFASDA
ncbi:MAG: RnfABCDGE type electron transport complex subunit D [Desulfofustis sp. PB-SRB1]|nr:RnfABCDGE type electron transport complex subunit D [Desulfofustis sp. PB-SRB1]